MKRDEATQVYPGDYLVLKSKEHYTVQDYGEEMEVGDVFVVETVRLSSDVDDILDNLSPAFSFAAWPFEYSYLDFELADEDMISEAQQRMKEREAQKALEELKNKAEYEMTPNERRRLSKRLWWERNKSRYRGAKSEKR